MLFQNRRLVRFIACYFLLQVLTTIAAPSVTWAMMGASQPEFTSYEASSSTDMVNLTTGDLSYGLPVLDVPGPERSFSMPLTYKAGIQLEQEATWVGLGWSLNPGAIARSVNGYPDDADGETVQMTLNKSVQRGVDASSFFGLFKSHWNSVTGYSGSVDLFGLASLNWDKDGIEGGDLVGIRYQAGEGLSVDPVRMAMAAVTIATLGGGTAIEVGLNLLGGAIFGEVTNAIMGDFGSGKTGGVASFNNKPYTYHWEDYDGDDAWETKFNQDGREHAYGSLYWGDMSRNLGKLHTGPDITNPHGPAATPTTQAPQFSYQRYTAGNGNHETAADIYQPVVGDEDYYGSSKRAISVAHDYFSVMGGDASGTMRPNRLDVGSVAYPKLGTDKNEDHGKYMVVPFLDQANDHYKVGFRYENSLSNGYNYHEYTPSAGNSGVGFNVDNSRNALIMADPRLHDPAARVEPLRTGIATNDPAGASSRQLVQGKHTVWYSNKEIEQMATYTNGAFAGYNNGFLNFATPHPGTVTTDYISTHSTDDLFRALRRPNAIGAFAVTTEDGTTYHYSLPVYHYATYSETNELRTSIVGSTLAKSTRTDDEFGAIASTVNDDGSITYNQGGFATNWLLTAITSSDYVDRNHSGTVDAADWGGWVRFDYGKFSGNYVWRTPYVGTAFSDANDPIEFESFTGGSKETYYLNSISTRTHTALFIKSARQDGRAFFSTNGGSTGGLGTSVIVAPVPSSSLRLDEIVLLDNATYAKMKVIDGIREANDPNTAPIPALSPANNASSTNCAPLESWGEVLDNGDLDADASGRLRTYLNANAIKRIHFNYNYELCQGTPNSFTFQYGQPGTLPPMVLARAHEQRGGKLTLKSVSFFGPTVGTTPTRIIPDFTFDYGTNEAAVAGTNPGYGKEKWDAFGMYCAGGAHNVTSHRPTATDPVAPWSLRKITTPLGGITEITYERDQYAHVSEFGTDKLAFSNTDCSTTLQVQNFSGNLQDYLRIGDKIKLTGAANYNSECLITTEGQDGIPYQTYQPTTCSDAYIEREVTIKTVSANTIELEEAPSPCTDPGNDCSLYIAAGMKVSAIIPVNHLGGDIRVAAITTKDELGNAYQVRYRYTLPGVLNAMNSSGVIAKEPPFLAHQKHAFENWFDYPSTPVIYSQATVLRGQFRNNDESDYTAREVYSFFTPQSNMVSEQQIPSQYYNNFRNPNGNREYQVEFYNNTVAVRTGMVGRPKAVRTYNHQGHEELSTEFTYAEQVDNPLSLPNQGHFTEGVMTNELLANRYFNTNRTTKHYYPAVMTGSRSARNGLRIENNNVLYDFFNGQTVETSFRNSRSQVYHTRTVPAYTLYPDMGPKAKTASNSNMLSQVAAQYVLKEMPSGPAYNPLQFLQTGAVISATAYTWQGNWATYRDVDANGAYGEIAGPYQHVWHPVAAYQWQSSMLNPDGSFAGFVNFVWQNAPNAHWVKGSETTRYDHYSHALETKDVNGAYAAVKTGFNQSLQLVSASNAKYTELAYSGGEDAPVLLNQLKHFGGEVVTTGSQLGKSPAFAPHTGQYVVQLNGGNKLFYRAVCGPEVTAGKTYRLSAWVHGSDLANSLGRLYASVNGTLLNSTSITSTATKKAGAWYRLLVDVVIPAGMANQTVEFGCSNTAAGSPGAPVYVDDFRVSPLVASINTKVYDARTNHVTYNLDNENLFTRYEYNAAGRLVKVYKEFFDKPGGTAPTERLIKEYDQNYARLHTANWVTVSIDCELSDGAPTGMSIRAEEDLNSGMPRATRTVPNGPSPACFATPCEQPDPTQAPTRLIPHTNICETAVADRRSPGHITCQGGVDDSGVPTATRTYHWKWPSDNSTVESLLTELNSYCSGGH